MPTKYYVRVGKVLRARRGRHAANSNARIIYVYSITVNGRFVAPVVST